MRKSVVRSKRVQAPSMQEDLEELTSELRRLQRELAQVTLRYVESENERVTIQMELSRTQEEAFAALKALYTRRSVRWARFVKAFTQRAGRFLSWRAKRRRAAVHEDAFSPEVYLQWNPDVMAMNWDAWTHFVLFGQVECRRIH